MSNNSNTSGLKRERPYSNSHGGTKKHGIRRPNPHSHVGTKKKRPHNAISKIPEEEYVATQIDNDPNQMEYADDAASPAATSLTNAQMEFAAYDDAAAYPAAAAAYPAAAAAASPANPLIRHRSAKSAKYMGETSVPSYKGTYQQNISETQPGLTTRDIASIRKEFLGLGLVSKSYPAQLAEKLKSEWRQTGSVWKMEELAVDPGDPVIETRRKFNELVTLRTLLSDYVDGVHDITECFDFLEKVIKRGSNLHKELLELKRSLCSNSGTGRINVANSHDLQVGVIKLYIKSLRDEFQFLIPNFDDPISITRENAKLKFEEMGLSGKHVMRESGRSIAGYFDEYINGMQPPVKVTHNVIGAIDGCKGECDTSVGPLTWKCSLYGIMESEITSRRPTPAEISENGALNLVSEIAIRYYDDYENPYRFKVINEIVLDAVIAKLPQGFRTRNATGNDYSRIITPLNPPSVYVDTPRYNLAVVALKTLCDKRIFQRLTTDYYGGEAGLKIAAISTTDWYVTIGHLLAYLNGEIPYFPKIFFSGGNSEGYMVYSYDDNGSDELLKHYAYYKGFESGVLYEQMQYTDGWIAGALSDCSNPEHNFLDFWDFLKTRAILNQRAKWESIKNDLREKVAATADAFESFKRNPTAGTKQLIDCLTQIPIVVPNLTEFFVQLSEEDDILFNGRLTKGIITNAYLNKLIPKGSIITEQQLAKARETLGSIERTDSRTDPQSMIKFAETMKLNIRQLNLEAGTSDLPIFKTDSIKIDGEYLILKYQPKDELPDVSYFNETNETRQITVEGTLKIKVPICTELLIKTVFNLIPATSRISTSGLIESAGKIIFDRVKDWLNLPNEANDQKANEQFCKMLLEATANKDDKQYNKLWSKHFLFPEYAGGKKTRAKKYTQKKRKSPLR